MATASACSALGVFGQFVRGQIPVQCNALWERTRTVPQFAEFRCELRKRALCAFCQEVCYPSSLRRWVSACSPAATWSWGTCTQPRSGSCPAGSSAPGERPPGAWREDGTTLTSLFALLLCSASSQSHHLTNQAAPKVERPGAFRLQDFSITGNPP